MCLCLFAVRTASLAQTNWNSVLDRYESITEGQGCGWGTSVPEISDYIVRGVGTFEEYASAVFRQDVEGSEGSVRADPAFL